MWMVVAAYICFVANKAYRIASYREHFAWHEDFQWLAYIYLLRDASCKKSFMFYKVYYAHSTHWADKAVGDLLRAFWDYN